MARNLITYAGLGVIACISVGTSIFWVDGLVRSTAGVALFVALIGFVVQFVRDDAAHKREIEKVDRTEERSLAAERRAHERGMAANERENRFALGVSSHMAKVAFDKHVSFCEEYATVADKALNEIFRNGPYPDAVHDAGCLLAIRRKHAVWITAEVDEKLGQFEQLFLEMGASAGYVEATRGEARESARQEHIDRMYSHFSTLTGAPEWQGAKLDQNKAVTATIHWLRTILGTEELNAMRKAFVRVAILELDGYGESPRPS
jgi:hypothetical protein